MSAVAAGSAFRPVVARALIGGRWRDPVRASEIRDPYRGDVVGVAPVAASADVEAAVAAAVAAREQAAAMPAYERAALLRRTAALIDRDAEALAELMTRETGKAIKDSQAEIRRSLETVLLAAEEAIRIEGRHVPLDGSPMGAGKLAVLMRFPVGVVAGITPFNAPFNLAAHKIAPSIAAGNAMVLKPPPQAPLIVHRLVELTVEAGLPPGMLNVVHGGAEIGAALISDPRVDFITFTGSSRAGAAIKAASGLRRVALELGGNNATIVHDDADLAPAAQACARNSMRLAGQSCVSVQSVYVQERVRDAFVTLIEAEVRKMKLGDPLDAGTDVGTLIDEAAARRVESWVHEAAAQGARVVTGGRRHGAAYEPTLLTGVKPSMRVVCEEVFGPVVNVLPYASLDEVFAAVNAGEYGLQAGIFTRSNEVSFRAIRALRVGGVIINGTSTWRTDQLAYGGVKASGIGREGPRYAIEEMTEQRLVVFKSVVDMRILVTGGGGFLGAAIVRALVARGDTAIAFDTQLASLVSTPHHERLLCVPGDISDLANVAHTTMAHKPDAVIHCAAIVGVLSSLGSPINVVRVNIEGSLNVFEAMRLAGVRRCIHLSSEEAYGVFRADRIDETHPLDPVLPYGICKAAVEQLGRSYRDLHGLEVVNLRTSWVYGPGLPRNRVPKNLVDAALAGRRLHVPAGADSAIDHTHVDDLVGGVLKALDHPQHRFDAYNVASGEATTVAGLVAIVRELLPGAELSVGPGAYRHGDQVEMVRKGALDIGRAAAELGWAPRYDIRSGLAAYIAALRPLAG